MTLHLTSDTCWDSNTQQEHKFTQEAFSPSLHRKVGPAASSITPYPASLTHHCVTTSHRPRHYRVISGDDLFLTLHIMQDLCANRKTWQRAGTFTVRTLSDITEQSQSSYQIINPHLTGQTHMAFNQSGLNESIYFDPMLSWHQLCRKRSASKLPPRPNSIIKMISMCCVISCEVFAVVSEGSTGGH